MNRKQRRTEKSKGPKASNPAQEIFNTALQHHQAGRLAEAEQLYRQVLTADPNHADAWHSMGVLARQAGRADIAVELIQQAINLKNNEPFYYNNLGTALQDQKNYTEALVQYGRAIELNPNYASAYFNMGNTLRIVCPNPQPSEVKYNIHFLRTSPVRN